MLASMEAQVWSGFVGSALSGVVMLVVLVVTLMVQSKQNKSLMDHQSEQVEGQLSHQQEQFEKQLQANEELLAKQSLLEREAASGREILRLRTEVQRAFLEIELIVSNGRDYEKFAELRYRILALNREIKSHVASDIREEYRMLADVYDRLIGVLKDRVNQSGGPLRQHRESLGEILGNMVGLQEGWVDAYLDHNAEERYRIFEIIKESSNAFEEAE